MRLVQAIVAVMAIGVFLLAGVAQSGATVLCKGIDGHVTVEAATQGVCTSSEGRNSDKSQSRGAAYTTSDRGDHCGRCVDSPLGIGKESSALAQAKRIQVKAPVVCVFLETSEPSESLLPPFAPGTDGLVSNPMLAPLRTVTLLI